MPDRLDPNHDKLVLTQAERRVLADLERDLAGVAGTEWSPAATPGWRYRLLDVRHRWIHRGPLLVPAGAIVMLMTLTSSLFVSFLGALLMALGLAAGLSQPWRRQRRERRQARAQRRITPPG